MVHFLRDLFETGQDHVLSGIGNDTALLDLPDFPLSLTMDTIREGHHFFERDMDLRDIGRKAAGVSLSDLAASAAHPEALLVSAGLHGRMKKKDREHLFSGLRDICEEFACPVVGGDLYETEKALSLTTAAIGTVRYGKVTRGGAKPGDSLYVTGQLGGSILKRHHAFTPRIQEAQTLVREGIVRGMMDLSDGLALDVDRMRVESDIGGAKLFARDIPTHPDAGEHAKTTGHSPLHHALYDGEDFELLFSSGNADISSAFLEGDPPVTRVGVLTDEVEGTVLVQEDQTMEPLDPAEGYLHFSNDQ